ncbi:MAG: shikimate kinase [Acidobacteriota bacterium]
MTRVDVIHRKQEVVTKQQIVIIGFMGTGKTTVAQELGRRLNCASVDLDELITKGEGRSPGEIIDHDGESRFRELETQHLREVLENESARVIAVGGGAWTIAVNRRLIADHKAISVWLDAPFELCWQRIEAGGEVRPLARSRDLAERLYAARQPFYELADARIIVSETESAEEIAIKVTKALPPRID